MIVSRVSAKAESSIDWTQYVTGRMPRGDFLSVPCTFPDLRDDRHLKGAIRYAFERQIRSLQTQQEQGTFIHRLVALAESLLRKVDSVPSLRPQKAESLAWTRRPIIDAKYKRHWEELQQGPWHEQDISLRESHREDLLQVLAYANLAGTADIVGCLVYFCSQATWESLVKLDRLFHRAELPKRGRRIRVWLTAVPMGVSSDLSGAAFGAQVRGIGSSLVTDR